MMTGSITLKAGDWQAEVLPGRGANLIALSYAGRPVLRTPASLGELDAAPCLYGNPILFPANRTAGGRFSFGGRSYSLPINEAAHNNHLHGFFHSAPFKVLERSGRSLSCRLQNDGELFPIPFTLTVHFKLDAAGLTQTLQLDSDKPLPVMLGLHTAFIRPSYLRVPLGQRWQRDEHFLPTGELLPLDLREQKYLNGHNPTGEAFSGFYTSLGRTAQLGEFLFSVSEGFNQWVLFSGGAQSGFICVEPQTAPVNALNRPSTCPVLTPGLAGKYEVRFGIAPR